MPDEVQTNDELTDKIQAALEAEPDAPAEPETPTEPEPTVNPDESAVEPQGEPANEPAPQETDYKQKFVDSQREAILLAERNKIKDAQLEKLTKTDTPTDEAMRLVYPEWDELNEVTKKALVKTEAQEMRQLRLESELSEFREEKKFKTELNDVIHSDDYVAKLLGKESEFKRFAANPKNKGISAEVLAKAFLFDVEEPAPQVPKTEGLPQGSGGSREPLKTKKVSLEEATRIRQTDNNRYMELVKSGMIDDDID